MIYLKSLKFLILTSSQVLTNLINKPTGYGGRVVKREKIPSQLVESIGWENEIVEIQFLNGYVHRFQDIPKIYFDELMLNITDEKIHDFATNNAGSRVRKERR